MKVVNPYNQLPAHHCFGCSNKNPIGLALEFELQGDTLICVWNPTKNYQGFEGMLHGGIISTILDEAGAWAIQILAETAGLTSELRVKYLRPVHFANGAITVKASLKGRKDRLTTVYVALLDGNDTLCAEAHIDYFVFPENIAKAKFRYPGIEAFIK